MSTETEPHIHECSHETREPHVCRCTICGKHIGTLPAAAVPASPVTAQPTLREQEQFRVEAEHRGAEVVAVAPVTGPDVAQRLAAEIMSMWRGNVMPFNELSISDLIRTALEEQGRQLREALQARVDLYTGPTGGWLCAPVFFKAEIERILAGDKL